MLERGEPGRRSTSKRRPSGDQPAVTQPEAGVSRRRDPSRYGRPRKLPIFAV
jgi:hypothetical protein